jgi:uncharacterized protein YfdQ (DUF2303 family)
LISLEKAVQDKKALGWENNMDDTAIRQIQESATADVLSTVIRQLETKEPVIAIPSGFSAESMEKFMPERSSYRVNYETISLDAFVDYCNIQGGENVKCFINTDAMKAKTYFDLGTKLKPMHRRHTAQLTPRITAAYKALCLLANSDRRISQKETAEFIEDWGGVIRVLDDTGSLMKNIDAARSVRNITVTKMKSRRTEVGNFSQEADIMEKAEAKNDNMPIPAEIVFNASPYLDFKERDFVLQLSINVDDLNDKIGLKFRIIKHDSIIEEIGEEFLDNLGRRLDGEIKSFIGSI